MAPPIPVRLTIAVAHAPALLLEALASMLESAGFQVTAACGDAAALVAAVAAEPPKVILAGCDDGDARPLHVLAAARRAAPQTCCVALVPRLTADLALAAAREEVDGVVEGTASCGELADSIRQVAAGHTVFPAGWLALLRRAEASSLANRLSARQIQVLELLARGLTNDEIASHLAISLNTVKFHLRQIYGRVGVANRVQAAALLAPHPSG